MLSFAPSLSQVQIRAKFLANLALALFDRSAHFDRAPTGSGRPLHSKGNPTPCQATVVDCTCRTG